MNNKEKDERQMICLLENIINGVVPDMFLTEERKYIQVHGETDFIKRQIETYNIMIENKKDNRDYGESK